MGEVQGPTRNIRRTLESHNEARNLKLSEIKVDYCINLTDSDENRDTVFVEQIGETEVVFTSGPVGKGIAAGPYQVILKREDETLRDEKGRLVTIYGRPTQYKMNGEVI